MKTHARRRFLAPMLLAPFGALTAKASASGVEGEPTTTGWIVGELRAVAFGEGPGQSAKADELRKLGWLDCAGQALDKEQFPELYGAIGDTWGAQPKGRFLLPDLRGFFLRGWQTKRQEENYEQLMGGDLVGRGDAPPAWTRPDRANVAYFIYSGRRPDAR